MGYLKEKHFPHISICKYAVPNVCKDVNGRVAFRMIGLGNREDFASCFDILFMFLAGFDLFFLLQVGREGFVGLLGTLLIRMSESKNLTCEAKSLSCHPKDHPGDFIYTIPP